MNKVCHNQDASDSQNSAPFVPSCVLKKSACRCRNTAKLLHWHVESPGSPIAVPGLQLWDQCSFGVELDSSRQRGSIALPATGFVDRLGWSCWRMVGCTCWSADCGWIQSRDRQEALEPGPGSSSVLPRFVDALVSGCQIPPAPSGSGRNQRIRISHLQLQSHPPCVS